MVGSVLRAEQPEDDAGHAPWGVAWAMTGTRGAKRLGCCLLGALGVLATGVVAPPAEACGGLFCSVGPLPQPVDQSAERIIFVVNADRTITAHVQIQYAGGSDSFAWVVPVPSTPTVAESAIALFQELDTTSGLTVQAPPIDRSDCNFDGGGGLSCGCGSEDSALARGVPTAIGEPTVTVYSSNYTANYQYAVIGAENTMDLVTWLQDNGYNVSSNMTPVMDPYNMEGMRFLAIKLRDGKTTRDIVPLKFTYEGTEPMVPIRLTAVAAQPLMGVLVMIVADAPFVPANYASVRPNTAEIAIDAQGRNSYFEWVAREADEAEGQLWVQESIIDLPRTGSEQGVLSRYYTRLSPHTMTVDPGFVRASDRGLRAAATLDFSARAPVASCTGVIAERQPSACAYNYCGRGSTCRVAGGAPVCSCPAGSVAQALVGPDGTPHSTCVPRANPVGVVMDPAMMGTAADPCMGYACGMGACVVKGGFPTCECPPGTAASTQGGTPTCAAAPTSAGFGPGAGAESIPKVVVSARPLGWSTGSLLVLLGVVVARRGRGARERRPS